MVDPDASLRRYFAIPLVLIFCAVAIFDLRTGRLSRIRHYFVLFLLTLVIIFFSLKSKNLPASALEVIVEALVYGIAISAFRYRFFDVVFLGLAVLYITISSFGCWLESDFFRMSASHDFGCRGITNHRNSYAPQIIFSTLLAVSIMRSRSYQLLALLIMVGLIFFTKSVTALSVSVLIVMLFFFRKSILATKIPASTLLFCVSLSSLVAIIFGTTFVTATAGREESFLIRVLIWGIAPSTLEGFTFFGEGYKSSYSSVILDSLTSATGWEDASGFHNSFFEMWRQVGLIAALVIVALGLLTAVSMVRNRSISNPTVYWFVVAVSCYFIYGLVESGFGIGFSVWSLIVLRLGWRVLNVKSLD